MTPAQQAIIVQQQYLQLGGQMAAHRISDSIVDRVQRIQSWSADLVTAVDGQGHPEYVAAAARELRAMVESGVLRTPDAAIACQALRLADLVAR